MPDNEKVGGQEPTLQRWTVRQGHLICAPVAQPMWQFWRRLHRQFDLVDHLPVEAVSQLQVADPIHAFLRKKKNENVYHFFGGFSSVELIATAPLKRVWICLHENPSARTVRYIAEASALKGLFYSLGRERGLASLHTAIAKHFPPERRSQLFGRRTVSRRYLAELAGVKPQTIRWQDEQVEKLLHQNGATLFEQLLRQVKGDG